MINLPNNPKKIVTYTPAGPVLQSFMMSELFVRGIMGPLGSGKSSGCVVEILRRAAEQPPAPNGLRKSRWAIIRNSYPELKTTTIKTWFEWCPQEYGRYTQDSPIVHHVKAGDLDMEVLFLALDRPEDVKKLLSLELTGAWLNESREIDKSILDALTGRVGRYPSKKDGGCKWSGIIMDTNPPDDQSWWYQFAEVQTPEGWAFFTQPGGNEPDAENITNLPTDYYKRISQGKDDDWIKVYVRGQYGFVTEGKPVYTMFRDRVHVSAERLVAIPKLPLLIGVDFGLTPSAIIGQKLPDGRWWIIDEFLTENCGIRRFAENLHSYINKTYPDNHVDAGWGDPAGNQRGQNDEKTALEIMNKYCNFKDEHELTWKAAPSNTLTMRLEAVMGAMNRLVDGNPGFLVSPACATLRKGLAGGYHYKYIQTGNGTQVHETPAKNKYSHSQDATQYLLLGGGEHHVVLGKDKKNKGEKKQVRIAKDLDYDVYGLGN